MQGNAIPPIAMTVRDAVAYTGIPRSTLYARRPELDWRKLGRRSLITRESLDALVASLPRVAAKPEATDV